MSITSSLSTNNDGKSFHADSSWADYLEYRKLPTSSSTDSGKQSEVSGLDEEFAKALATAIQPFPALYDPCDPCYRTNENYRNECWEKIKKTIKFKGNIQQLSEHWQSLKEEYRQWRYKKIAASNNLVEPLKWLDKFVIPLYERVGFFAALNSIDIHVKQNKKIAKKRNIYHTDPDENKRKKFVYDIPEE